jgi:hypothetical protein
MISIPVSPKLPTAAWPRPGVPDFAFAVHSYGGPQLGTGLCEYDWQLQVEARCSLVSLEYFRSDADIPGTPIGLFRTPVGDQALRDFHAVVTGSRLFTPLPSMAEHVGYTESTYTWIEPPSGPRQQIINNSDEMNHVVIAPVLAKTSAMLSESFNHPEKNIGVDKVCLTDPRWIVAAGPNERSVVMISEFAGQKPGESVQLDWKDLPLAPMASRPRREALVTLEPGATWQATTAIWKRDPGKQYLAQFTWARFGGDALMNGIYRIRGRADSPRILIEPK